MIFTMKKPKIFTMDKIQKFLEIDEGFEFELEPVKSEIYNWLRNQLDEVVYCQLTKKQKGFVLKFIKRVTPYSKKQIKRLIHKYKKKELFWNKQNKKSIAYSIYNRADVELLHRTDKEHKLSGKATKSILQREWFVFSNKGFRKLANISVSHIYNLRKTKTYLSFGRIFNETKSVISNIGIRMKPRPNGHPGYLRVDTVHQGDKNKVKGIYHINIIDEVTQIEFVFSVPAISQKYMKQILQLLSKICWIKIVNFHSDNGSEYINKIVAQILNKEHIKQTKSRSRKTNDNALVESKNGSVIRKHFGHFHIPATKENADKLNEFHLNYFITYLNFHRPCGFVNIVTDKKGKQKKIYNQKDYQTPYEKLKSLPNAKQYLKKGITFEKLDKIAYNQSDTEFAREMNKKKREMFNSLKLDF